MTDIKEFPELETRVQFPEQGAVWTPVIIDGAPGFKVEYDIDTYWLLLNPSSDSEEGNPDVFIYLSDKPNVIDGIPLCYIEPQATWRDSFGIVSTDLEGQQ